MDVSVKTEIPKYIWYFNVNKCAIVHEIMGCKQLVTRTY